MWTGLGENLYNAEIWRALMGLCILFVCLFFTHLPVPIPASHKNWSKTKESNSIGKIEAQSCHHCQPVQLVCQHRWHPPQSVLSNAHYSKITPFILRMSGPSRKESPSPQKCWFHLHPQRQTHPSSLLHFKFYPLLICCILKPSVVPVFHLKSWIKAL